MAHCAELRTPMTATKLLSAAVMGAALTVAGLPAVAQEQGTADSWA